MKVGQPQGGVDITRANLAEVNLSKVKNLVDAKMAGVKGLTKEQLEACKAEGAIIDEYPPTHSSPSTTPISQPSQNNNVQTPATSSTQGSAPTSDPSEGNDSSSQPSPKA